MKTCLKKMISLAISFVMVLFVTNVTLFFEVDADTYEERGTITFGSVG